MGYSQDSGADSDSDELADIWETSHFGDITSQDASGDPDGDGYFNEEEFDWGLNPNVAGGLPGYLSQDIWNDLPGTKVEDLLSSDQFFEQPDQHQLVLGADHDLPGDNLGSRLRGTLTAPVSGSYTFWIAGDDGVELWLSSDESKFGRQRIAWHESHTAVHDWDAFPTQTSSPISLIAGQKYYIEAFHKEGRRDSHVSIAWCYEADDLENIALNPAAIASQSSIAAGGEAARAIDGNNDGNFGRNSVTHTSGQEDGWWQVDLGSSQNIQKIVLFNRTGGSTPRRLSNFRVSIHDIGGAELYGRDYHTEEGYVNGHLTIELEAPILGRIVKVSLLGPNLRGDRVLSLAEVEVMSSISGAPEATPLGYLTNWTQEAGVVATQSSITAGGEASRAIDGNRNGSYGRGSVTHTDNIEGSWWQVDLGEERSVMRVALYNRTGSAQTRLSNYRIVALDSAGVEVAQQGFYQVDGHAPYFSKWDLPAGVSARTIRVERLGLNRRNDHVISLAEVEVLGSEISIVDSIRPRELLPVSVLESFTADQQDPDDDYLPTDWELQYGFDPNNAQDILGGAFGDPDGDLISNWMECRLGTNPLVPNSFLGALTEEVWLDIDGIEVETLHQSAAFLDGPDLRRLLFASEGTRYLGPNTGTRIRGYLTAPQTGDYYFWVSGNDRARFWLSSDQDKFNKELILAPALPTDYQDYDLDSSQKSVAISLVAGETYFVELELKEGTGFGESPVSLAWQRPGGERELIDSDYLSTYGEQANDLDDDDLPDDWEIANGLDATDNGSVNAAEGAYGDWDSDGLTNLEEYQSGFNPIVAGANQGLLNREVWTNLRGIVYDITSQSTFPNQPDEVSEVAGLLVRGGSFYGTRYRAISRLPPTANTSSRFLLMMVRNFG